MNQIERGKKEGWLNVKDVIIFQLDVVNHIIFEQAAIPHATIRGNGACTLTHHLFNS